MIDNINLLPTFVTEKLDKDLVQGYFEALPQACQLTADILANGSFYDETVPFADNHLLSYGQTLISRNLLDKEGLDLLLKAIDIVDFKIALLFFLQLRQVFGADSIIKRLQQLQLNHFLTRLYLFSSVFVGESLLVDAY